MHRFAYSLLFFVVFLSRCLQAERFDFVSNGAILATIEFRRMPATLEDFVALTFTDAGEKVFGFGSVYAGEFDIMPTSANVSHFVISEFDGGLAGLNSDGALSASIEDLDPPSNTLTEVTSFYIAASDGVRPDRIGLRQLELPSSIITEGRFLFVPEPKFNKIFVLSATFLAIRIRRRRRRPSEWCSSGYRPSLRGKPRP